MGNNILDFIPIEYSHLLSFRETMNDILPILAGIALTLILLKNISRISSINGVKNTAENINSSPRKLFKLGISQFNIEFSNIAGMKEAKNEIYEFVEFLKNPKKFEVLGAKIPHGTLLVGAPGTVVILLKYLLECVRVGELFLTARKHAPSIVFIDEIDVVGKKRSKNNEISSSSNDERKNKPKLDERRDIFNIYIKPLKLSIKLSKNELINYSATAILAVRRSSTYGIVVIDFDNASDKIIGGLKRIDGYLFPKEKNIFSFHESGHVIVSLFLKYSDPTIKILIVPRSNANSIVTGYVMDNEIGLTTFNYFNNNGEIHSFYKPFSEAFAEIIDRRIQNIFE
ncbi:hypothetical protein FG379_002782 [Cryptosporidium bovis]|uniref:uncharacterized protein n=1 Tax=Cryptosporidium bovis TaxID=310047 RepID=UPI003519ED1D|nr:hypothetical protein FG379_002782 [Cryptosporidium bovis]